MVLLFQQFYKTHIILTKSQLIVEYFVGSNRNQFLTTGTITASEIPDIIDIVRCGE